jgi:hypothetical protein
LPVDLHKNRRYGVLLAVGLSLVAHCFILASLIASSAAFANVADLAQQSAQ